MAKKYSLIMGIENYPEISGQAKVNYAGNDAKAMADYARQAVFHLIDDKPLLDEDATYKKVIEKLGYLFHIADADDFILLYFAGHGFYSEDGGYLIPFDYQEGNAIDESSCISFDSINKRFKNKKTKHFIFLLDTCHSGYAGKQMDIRDAKPGARDIHITPEAGKKIKSEMEAMLHKDEISRGVGRLIFTSSAPTEKSHHTDDFQHGLFTHYLLSGLKSTVNKKQVNVEDLVRGVKDNVLAYCLKKNWEQTPTAYSHIQGDFYLPAYETQPRKGELVSAPNFSQDIEKARKALQSKDFDSAARILNTILQKDSLNLEANLLLEELDAGRNLQILKEKTEIRQHYEEWLRRGEGFRKAGEFSKAKECFENAARIYPDNPMAQSYIKEIDTREQIIKIDAIDAPVGDKAAILKNLFQSANNAFNKGDFTAALNHYNKILKTYPGNQRAIKEKLQLFEKWLQQYKDSTRYFEILGLLENIILPDESMRDDHVRFEGEYNETILLYTQAFLKSRISSEIEPVIKEIKKKEERKEDFEKLLNEYHDLAMEREYNELLKITEKLKSELDHIKDRIKLKSEIIGIKNIFETQEKAVSDHVFTILESLINEGITDKYILNAYKQIESKLKDQKNAEWDRSYKVFDSFSIKLYFVFNFFWGLIMAYHYGDRKVTINKFGCVVAAFFTIIIGQWIDEVSKNLNPSILREEKFRIILYELGKFWAFNSITILCYINMLNNPEIFFNWHLIYAVVLVFISLLLINKAIDSNKRRTREKSKLEANDESASLCSFGGNR